MHRLKLGLVIIAALALVTASAAVAWHKHGKTHTDPVTATLAANQTAVKTKTCTGEDGTYQRFHGKWTGTATSTDPRLAGTLKVHASGLINTTLNSGQVTGSLRIRGAQNGAKAHFWAVINGTGGQLSGFVVGWAYDKTGNADENKAGSGRLLGTLTGTLATNGAFAGQIGTAAVPAKANIQGGGCRNGNGDGHRKKRKGR